ncbi:protein tri1 [Phtheirospermum japonicum]|uniref:Protein tri1 n=1 Tax=Phtheirospermum japonicum TaxID=374723 RepID=A0A830D1L9_9LAMI|nr:protein tri1 [Phtheirospermum japonicum]
MSGLLRGSRALFAAAKSANTTNISPSATKKASSTAAAASKPLKRGKEKKPSESGIMRTTPISPALQSVLGAPEASRVSAVKKIWEYIKLHNLQNPLDKREIFCDAKLKKLFDGKDKVGFLEIGKLLSPHFVKTG